MGEVHLRNILNPIARIVSISVGGTDGNTDELSRTLLSLPVCAELSGTCPFGLAPGVTHDHHPEQCSS